MARGAALLCSLGLGVFVVAHAQFGCDAPASAPETPKVEPSTDAKAEPTTPVAAPAVAEPSAPAAEPEAAKADAPIELVGKPKTDPGSEPVYMPASKSGGDWGAARLPLEPQQQQAPNPAPSRGSEPTQQAPQP